MIDRNGLVPDTSVLLKWYLPDEEYVDGALHVLALAMQGTLALAAPSLLWYEVANGLRTGFRRKALTWEQVVGDYDRFLRLNIRCPVSEGRLAPRMVELAGTLDMTPYDASYIAMAEHTGFTLVTADDGQYLRARRIIPNVMHIANFPIGEA